MKITIFILFSAIFSISSICQEIKVISRGNNADSSYYDILKINDNEFWIAGEYGILKKIDTLGNISPIVFHNEGLTILKLLKVGEFVFIATAEGVIYKYDIVKKEFQKKAFATYKTKCFYDIIALKNGKLLVCGGNTAISKDHKRIPLGFIAVLDQNLEEIDMVWNSYRKFVWSLLQVENENVLAVSFDGLNTFIIKSDNLKNWRKEFNIKGLIHKIAMFDYQIWYCGAKNIRYVKNGIVGKVAQSNERKQYHETGCLWNMNMFGEKIISVTQDGSVIKMDKNIEKIQQIKIPNAYTLYDFEQISDTKIITVGHGKGAYIVQFN